MMVLSYPSRATAFQELRSRSAIYGSYGTCPFFFFFFLAKVRSRSAYGYSFPASPIFWFSDRNYML